MIINHENFFGSLLNNLSQLLNPPKDLILRGHCSAYIDGIQNISNPEILTNPDTQIKYCVCPHKRKSDQCKLSAGVIAKAEPHNF